MSDILKVCGDFLGTKLGFWFTVAASFAIGLFALFGLMEFSTWALSEIAIVLPAFIIYSDRQRAEAEAKRLDLEDKRLDRIEERLATIQSRLAALTIK